MSDMIVSHRLMSCFFEPPAEKRSESNTKMAKYQIFCNLYNVKKSENENKPAKNTLGTAFLQ
jgi:hypothetical protein